MCRRGLLLTLVWLLLAPPAALLRALPSAWFAPAASKAVTLKICPCTQKVGCNCCGCMNEADEDDDETPATPSKPGGGPELRCPCGAVDLIEAGVDLAAGAAGPRLCWHRPRLPEQVGHAFPRWVSATAAPETPPPRA